MKKNSSRFLLIWIILLPCFLLHAQTEKPQEPLPPYDYDVEDVSFYNQNDSIKLSATLTTPKDLSDFATVILVSGSGPQDRNSELLGHKPFLVIADYLTQNGIGVLRVDDRGIAKSEGDYNASSLRDFVNDNIAALEYLKNRNDINSKRIGIIGHSLGGAIAPIIASEHDEVAFIILLAGPGVRGDKLMLSQKALVEKQMGVAEEAIKVGQENLRGAYDIIVDPQIQNDSLRPALQSYFKKAWGGMLPENQQDMLSTQLATPWLADFIRHDPKTVLSKTNCPVLALNGSKDLQVPSSINLEAIESILKSSGNTNVTVREMQGLNHLFQECETGMPQEYAIIQQTFSPLVLDILEQWINDLDY